MPAGTHTIEVPLDIQTIWNFVHDMNNWAPLVPGYIEHNILSEKQSTWAFKGDLGFMKKTVKLQIDIKEWKEPSEVTFDLKGISDNFKGGGYFKAEKIDEKRTAMTGHLEISAGGMMGAMVNQILVNFVPKTAEELTQNIVNDLLSKNKA